MSSLRLLLLTCCWFALCAEDLKLANEHVLVRFDEATAGIDSMALLGVEPIELEQWLIGEHGRVPPADAPLPVLGAFNQNGRQHNWVYRIGEPTWTATSEPGRIVFTATHPSQPLLYRLVATLEADRPTVITHFVMENIGQEPQHVTPTLVALNGIHQDLGTSDDYYLGIYAGDRDGGMTTLSFPPTPASAAAHALAGEPQSLADYGFVSLRSRFFAAFWEPLEQRVVGPQGEPQVEAPSDGPGRSEVTTPVPQAVGAGIQASLTPRGFRSNAGKLTQRQAWFDITWYDPNDRNGIVLAPGERLELRWQTTVSLLTSDGLALLDEGEQEIEYPGGMIRFFRILSIAMVSLLSIIHAGFAVIGLDGIGWGLSVIVVTFVIKLALHRLNFKSQRSMMMMQKLGPELKKLKAQYGEDQRVMAQKQMELWRKHGVNPIGGCLPLFIQFPIFIALYQTFGVAADLRGQSFLWIPDLTLPDYTFYLFDAPVLGAITINILPIIYMGVSLWMGLSQKMPEGADETQQQMAKMMRFLPVIFGLIFYRMPAGLVLYFTINIVLSSIEMRYVRAKLGMQGTTTPVM